MGESIAARLAAAGLPPLPRTAWLELDLDALAGNLRELRAQAGGAGIPVFPVVKADAYGHGAVPIARALVAAGADGLCVAALDEALALRRAGLSVPIRVLYPVPPALARAGRRRADRGRGRGCPDPRPDPRRPRRPARDEPAPRPGAGGRDRPRPGWGRARCGRRPGAGHRGGPGRPAGRSVDASPGERGAGHDRRAAGPLRRRRGATCGRRASSCPSGTSPPAAGS